MYVRSLVVVALCAAFIAGVAIALNYETAGIGRQSVNVTTTTSPPCTTSQGTCEGLAINSAILHEINYTDELGPVSYATLEIGLNASGKFTITKLNLFIDNSSAGSVQGPFQPGVNKIVNVTLPATLSVTPGKTYTLAVEGFYGGGSTVWQTTKVTAR